MNEAIKIQISAFVDGELADNETELLLRRLCQDAELRTEAARYLAIGRAVRGDTCPSAVLQLRGRIAAALGEDAARSAPPAEVATRGLGRPLAGVAIAASVAVAALVGLRQLSPVDAPARALDDLQAVAIDDGPSYTEPPVVDSMSDRPSDMLTLYYLRHGEQAPNLGSRLVGLEVRQDSLATATATAPDAGAADDQDISAADPVEPAEESVQTQ